MEIEIEEVMEDATSTVHEEEQHDYVNDQLHPPRTVTRNSTASQISQISQGNVSITQRIPEQEGSVPTNNPANLIITLIDNKLVLQCFLEGWLLLFCRRCSYWGCTCDFKDSTD